MCDILRGSEKSIKRLDNAGGPLSRVKSGTLDQGLATGLELRATRRSNGG
jgi:hypothetical protein